MFCLVLRIEQNAQREIRTGIGSDQAVADLRPVRLKLQVYDAAGEIADDDTVEFDSLRLRVKLKNTIHSFLNETGKPLRAETNRA